MDDLLNYIHHYTPLTKEAEQDVRLNFKEKAFKKGEILHQEGNTCRNIYFILQGTARTFYTAPNKDVTTWIYPEGHFVTAWHSFLSQQESYESVEALQDVQVAFISKITLDSLYQKHPVLESFGRKLAEQVIITLDAYSKGYMFLSAKEKYKNLLDMYPNIDQKANLGHIATMLGISQETLSRVRNKLD